MKLSPFSVYIALPLQLQLKCLQTPRGFHFFSFCIQFYTEDSLLGYGYKNQNSSAINRLIMVTKSYIYSNYSRKCSEININELLHHIKKVYDELKLLALLEFQSTKFEKKNRNK